MTIPKITNLTPTCQQPTFTAAGLVAALEQAWAAIRTRHPEVPAAVLVVGSGSPATPSGTAKFGHFAALRWQSGDAQLPEVLVSGEGLSRTPAEVFTTLLHEATHGLADARGVQDTSRQGRWHNKQFAKLAAELGMATTKDDKFGYSPCTLTDQAIAEYAEPITVLGTALSAFRHPEPTGEAKGRTNNNNGVTAVCECDPERKIRLSTTVFDLGPIVCGLCKAAFLPDDVDRDTYELPTFGQPCQHDDQGDTADTDSDNAEDPMVFYDPTGAKYGIPTYPYRMAPTGLATVRQLRAENLRPGGQDVVAQLMWRKGKRVAYLYRIDLAKPKRTATPAQLAALDKAHRAQRTCPTCTQVKDYYIPRSLGECLDCHPTGGQR